MEHEAAAAHTYIAEYAPLFGFALVFVLIFRRMGLGATLGYLVAGALVGPQLLNLVGEAETKMGIAEFGIALLLFLVGLELSPARLWRMKQDIFGFGLLQVVLCGLVISAVVALGAGFSPEAALALGLPLALSSTAQVLPMLQSAGRMKTPFGERAFAILLFQDLSIVPLITRTAQAVQQPLRQLNGRGSPCCSKLRRMYSPSGTSSRIVRCSCRQCTVIGWLRMAGIQRGMGRLLHSHRCPAQPRR